MKQTSKWELFSLAMILCLSSLGQAPADKILGLYWSPKKDAQIEIYKKAGHYFGKSIWIKSPRKDVKNPVESLRKNEVLGLELLDGTYTGGQVYDPESGKTYECKMTLSGNSLKVRGYIGISLFGRTELFERIN